MHVIAILALALAIPVRPERGLSPAPPPARAVTIHGNWQMVEYHFSGKALPKTTVDNISLTIEGTELRLVSKSVTTPYALVYDPSKTPAVFDFKSKKNGTVDFKGIVRVDGDLMTICFTRDSTADRPTQFERNRQDFFYWQLRRVSP